MSDTQEPTFPDELEALINKHCLERHSHTPDFILAEYMSMCLSAFNNAVFARSRFYEKNDEAVEQLRATDVLEAPACCASFVAYGVHHEDCRNNPAHR